MPAHGYGHTLHNCHSPTVEILCLAHVGGILHNDVRDAPRSSRACSKRQNHLFQHPITPTLLRRYLKTMLHLLGVPSLKQSLEEAMGSCFPGTIY